MESRVKLTDDAWVYGSYPRITYKKDTIYTFYLYRDVQAVYNMGRFHICDGLMERLFQEGLISDGEKAEFDQKIYRFIAQVERYDDWPIEKIYGEIQRIRKSCVAEALLEQDQERRIRQGCDFILQGGIDQNRKKEELIEKREALVFAVCEPELFFRMKQDVKKALERGRQVYILVSGGRGNSLLSESVVRKNLFGENALNGEVTFLTVEDENLGLNLAGISWNAGLQAHADAGAAALFVYGEEGLLHCRNLQVDAIVTAIPKGYYTRALVNQLDGERACVVYVPKHFNITEWVGMTEKTVLSYWQLNRLWKDYGDVIYDRSVPELYQTYPQYFINIYENGDTCPEAAAGYPIRVKTDFLTGNRQTAGTREDMAAQKDVIRVFYERRNEAIRSYLDRGESLRYIATYFDENLEEKEIPWCAETQQSGILVHGIRAREAKGSQIIRCDGSKTLRQQLKKPESEAGEKAGQPDAKLQLFSNFLFFLTPKPAQLYNELRADRPGEQIDFTQGHLDYMLYEKDGKRIETFPLWRKACIAMKKDGRFLFFHYRLGSGVMTVGNYSISWTEADVDTPTGDDTEHLVRIYTPYFSQADQEADSAAYVLPVGENRLNLVVIQERIFAIRRGEVLLPSIGVVISLDMEHGEAFLRQTGCRELEDGYYDCGGLEFRLNLDGPAQIAPEEWQQVEWAFGGGLSLILNGAAIYGEEESSDWLVKEGWLSPLSRQTQESEIHMPARHPRTAIGIAENGDLVILVFSGRTFMSTGADYRDMCRIAKKLIPDIWCMMNVDGGGSSVLGMAIDGNFMELSYPATSLGSTAGMVRQVNTVLCLEQ